MRKLSVSLEKLIDQEQQWKLALLSQWPKLVRQYCKMPITLLKITGNAITVGVTHSILAQELSFSSPILKRNINNFLKSEQILNIYIRIVAPAKPTKKSEIPKNLQTTPPKQYSLTTNEQNSLTKLEDLTLKKALKDFLIRCKKVS